MPLSFNLCTSFRDEISVFPKRCPFSCQEFLPVRGQFCLNHVVLQPSLSNPTVLSPPIRPILLLVKSCRSLLILFLDPHWSGLGTVKDGSFAPQYDQLAPAQHSAFLCELFWQRAQRSRAQGECYSKLIVIIWSPHTFMHVLRHASITSYNEYIFLFVLIRPAIKRRLIASAVFTTKHPLSLQII